ncbi:tyrosine-type recombinase/integrase [Enterococcus sp. CWB-B31]|uniref:tyrosine-type recombinase/integrase n=1 Tax=Enterococcus sp. CWB-B31 TaxID=2885159 RepID=UPI003B634D22
MQRTCTFTCKKLELYGLRENYCSTVIIGLATGMRIGELCGLKWTDIDFTEDIINIKHTL